MHYKPFTLHKRPTRKKNRSEETREGVQAFLAKEKSRFRMPDKADYYTITTLSGEISSRFLQLARRMIF